MRQIRTDMAMESAREAGDMPGVKVSGWENAGIHVTEVQLTDPDSAQKLGKPVGNYITLESEALRRRDPDARLAMSAMIGEEIARMAGEIGERGAMVVGLGNRMVTPDALGPLTVDKILVTRQIFQELTQYADERLRSLLDIKVYVEADADERILRRISRDVEERGRDLNGIIDQYLTTVKPMHYLYVEPTRAKADIVINSGKNNVAFDLFVSKIGQLLKELKK